MRAELLIARSMVRERMLPHIQLPVAMDRYYELAHRYFAKTNAKKIIMENEKGDFYVIDYVTRFSPRYTKQLRKRFSAYYPQLTPYSACKTLFLTLTVDPKTCLSLHHARVTLNKAWGRITNLIRRAFRLHAQPPRKQRSSPSLLSSLIHSITFSSFFLKPLFIKSYEFQRSGSIHLHGLLVNVAFFPQQLLHLLHNGRNRIEVIRYGLRAGIRYVYKYIVKNHRYGAKYDEGVGLLNDHTILAWALGLRTFSISLSLSNKGISHQNSPVDNSVPKGDESGDRNGSALSKPTYHKLMVVGILPPDTVGYYERGQLIGLLAELIEMGSMKEE